MNFLINIVRYLIAPAAVQILEGAREWCGSRRLDGATYIAPSLARRVLWSIGDTACMLRALN